MCFPPAIIAAGLAVAGSGLKYFGDKKAASAQERVNQRERTRQKDMTAEQQSVFEDSLAKVGDTASDASIKAATDKRNSVIQAALTPASAPANYLPGNQSAPAIVKEAARASVGKEKAAAGGLAAALAALGATGDQMQGMNIGLNRNSQKIGQIARNKYGSANVLGSELQAAAFKGGTMRGLGQLAQMIGSAVGGMGGLPDAPAFSMEKFTRGTGIY